MYHMAYVTSTLTSPVKHRQAYGTGSAPNSFRVDLSLPFDPNDEGVYVVETFSSGYCFVYMGWFLNNAPSQAEVSDAYPVNFHQVGAGTDIGDGTLRFQYTWGQVRETSPIYSIVYSAKL